MDIYIDVLVIINVYISWILLSLIGAITHTKIKPLNLALASLLGGLSSLLVLLQEESMFVKVFSLTVRVLIFVIIVYVAFWNQPKIKTLIYAAIYLAANIMLSGTIELIMGDSGSIYVISGAVYIDVPLLLLIAVTAFVYISVNVISKITDLRYSKTHSYAVSFEWQSQSFRLNAVADTGNTACDIFSGKPIIVCNGISLYTDDADFLRAVPYKTVSGDGVLYAVRPKSIVITDESGEAKAVDALIASSEKKGEPLAIFNPKLLR